MGVDGVAVIVCLYSGDMRYRMLQCHGCCLFMYSHNCQT